MTDCKHTKRKQRIVDTREPREDDPDQTKIKWELTCDDCGTYISSWWSK